MKDCCQFENPNRRQSLKGGDFTVSAFLLYSNIELRLTKKFQGGGGGSRRIFVSFIALEIVF